MSSQVKELRHRTGLSQSGFAKAFQIPVSTLRKWEQGETEPAPYIIRLLAAAVPGDDPQKEEIMGPEGELYYFSRLSGRVSDRLGNEIPVKDDLQGVSRHNLGIYLRDLFADYYRIRERFENDCRFDRTENIEWQ